MMLAGFLPSFRDTPPLPACLPGWAGSCFPDQFLEPPSPFRKPRMEVEWAAAAWDSWRLEGNVEEGPAVTHQPQKLACGLLR